MLILIKKQICLDCSLHIFTRIAYSFMFILSSNQVQVHLVTHILSIKEDRTTETDEAAIAAEPIHG